MSEKDERRRGRENIATEKKEIKKEEVRGHWEEVNFERSSN